MIGKILFTQGTPDRFSGKIVSSDGKTYYFDKRSMVNYKYLHPNTEVEFTVYRFPDGKEKATHVKKYVKMEGNQLPDDKLETINQLIAQAIKGKPFLDCALVPNILKNNLTCSVDYKMYSPNLEEFVKTYLKGYTVKRKYPYNNVILPMVLVRKDAEESTEEQSARKGGNTQPTVADDTESESNTITGESSESAYQTLKKLYDKGAYEELLRSETFLTTIPVHLGIQGITVALKALAKFLEIGPEDVELDDFQKVLFSERDSTALRQYYNNERLMQLGAQATLQAMSAAEFRTAFARLYSGGKETLNNNWRNIAERFLIINNNMALLVTGLWIIASQRDFGIDLYIEDCAARNVLAKDLLYLLRVYTSFTDEGHSGLGERLQKKVVGHYLDRHNIQHLDKVSRYFDREANPKLTEVIDCLVNGTYASWRQMYDWFTCENGERLGAKVINYLWWRDSPKEVSSDIIRALSAILWQYDSTTYFTEILYNSSCPQFSRDEKEKLLISNFHYICEDVKSNKKAFLLASYVYSNYIPPQFIPDYDDIWQEAEKHVKLLVENQLSETLSSAQNIRLFQFDNEIRTSLESYYCKTFVSEVLKRCETENEIKEIIQYCEANGLSFITQWIKMVKNLDSITEAQEHFQSLMSLGNYAEAIQFATKESTFNPEKKKKLIKDALCWNFTKNVLQDSAYKVFDRAIPAWAAESILLESFVFNNIETTTALISLYVYTKEWMKMLYLYLPLAKTARDTRSEFIDNVERVLQKNNIPLHQYKFESHLDVLRAALKVFDAEEFDSFIEWARGLSVPTDAGPYKPSIQCFDTNLRDMTRGGDYNLQWKKLVARAIRTDKNERLDYTHYAIIVSYAGRAGMDEFVEQILYQQKMSNNTKRYSDIYSCLWKGLINSRYGANFLRITRPLIRIAPPTFWNVFYDNAVCKNHVFSATDFELAKLNGVHNQIQEFYDELLDRYSNTRESVFVKIAAQILIESSELKSPRFELLIPFCSSNQNKDEIILALIRLTAQKRFLGEIKSLIETDCWRCTDSEAHVLQALHSVIVQDLSFFLEDENAFADDEQESIEADYLECMENYPDIRLKRPIYERIKDYNKAYQYRLMQLIILSQTGTYQRYFLNDIVASIPEIHDDPCVQMETRYYLNFMITLHKRQLEIGSDDVGFLKNRYFRILAAEFILSDDRSSFSDDEIIALMRRNKHFTIAHSDYRKFKNSLLALAQRPGLTEHLLETFVVGFISNNWGTFVHEVNEYSTEALALIRQIESSTNYRDLNIYFLKDFIYDNAPEDTSKIEKIEICSPLIASVMKEIRKIYLLDAYEYQSCKRFLSGICHFSDINKAKLAYENLQRFLKKESKDLHKHRELYMNALTVTSYAKTFVNILSERIRERREIDDVTLWQPVFAAFNATPTYFYLVAVKNAMARNLSEAKKYYGFIPSLDDLPAEWNAEVLELQSYIAGEKAVFYPRTGNNMDAYAAETDATNVSFVLDAAQKNFIEEDDGKSVLEHAVESFKTLMSESLDMAEKYSCYRQLFIYVKKPEDLYNVYRKAEGKVHSGQIKKVTFNELVIDYGCLAIAIDEQLRPDEKLDILVEVFDVYGFLNDLNKDKPNIIDALRTAEQVVLETTGVSFQKWIDLQDKIRKILCEPFLSVDERDFETWVNLIGTCTSLVRSSESEVGLLDALESWRKDWNLLSTASNIENAFVRSVDAKIVSLRAHANLRIDVNSSYIEDGSIFYQIINTSPSRDISVVLNNEDESAAQLITDIIVDGDVSERFENASFSNEMILRPNDSCGQRYRLPEKVLRKLSYDNVLTVKLNIVLDGKVVCCNDPKERTFTIATYEPVLKPENVSEGENYRTDVAAFTSNIPGFGRDNEKAALRRLLSKGSLAIIYGPSRVGKSSLLNYIGSDYFDEYCKDSGRASIMQIRVADEVKSPNSYTKNLLKAEEPVQFASSTQIMEYLFYAPLKVAFTVEGHPMCRFGVAPFPENVRTAILDKLDKRKGSVAETYGSVSQILSTYNCELWIMYDEFQYVVEHWVGSADELAELCTFIKFGQENRTIKLVFCGSDDLVRIFECDNDPNWGEFKAKTFDSRLKIGQLNEADFASMMNDREVWAGLPETIPWNLQAPQLGETKSKLPAGLKTLYDYSGGNAICGKLIGRELRDKATSGAFANRRYLYPADITQATYEVLNAPANDLKTALIAHATKNPRDEQPYLLYMAKVLASDYNKADVSLYEIMQFFESKPLAVVETALKVLVARGIIVESKAGPDKYTFTNLFYYDIYRDLATDGEIQKLREAEIAVPEKQDNIIPWLDQVTEIVKEQPRVTPGDIVKIIEARPAEEKLEERVREHYKSATYNVSGNTTIGGTQNIVQYNAQTINTAFSTMFSDPELSNRLDAFKKMPKFEAFYSEEEKNRVKELQASIRVKRDRWVLANGFDNGASLDLEETFAPERELEVINSKAQTRYNNQMIATGIQQIASRIQQADSRPCAPLFADPGEEEFHAALGIERSQFNRLKKLPSEYYRQLCFAVQLHKMILPEEGKAVDYTDVDFSPLSIMYCKLVEIMLKEKHLEIYGKALSKQHLQNGISFGDLIGEDNKEHLIENWKDITIGTFTWHIIFRDVIISSEGVSNNSSFEKNIDGKIHSKAPNIGRLSRATGDSEDAWKEHAMALAEVQEIRNHSAHGGIAISKTVFDYLMGVLFRDDGGEIVRIWDLYLNSDTNDE